MVQKESGFSLIEVLVSVVILSIVSIALISIFSQSLRSSNTSMEETTAANLASYAASYLQRETLVSSSPLSFEKLRLKTNSTITDVCPTGSQNTEICNQVFHPVINGIQYQISLTVKNLENPDPQLLSTVFTVKKDQTDTSLFSLKGVLSNEKLNQEFPFELSTR